MICDEEYPKRVAVDLLFKINEAFSEFVYTEKLDLQSITKDTSLKFKYINTIISEWQNPNDSKYIYLRIFIIQRIIF